MRNPYIIESPSQLDCSSIKIEMTSMSPREKKRRSQYSKELFTKNYGSYNTISLIEKILLLKGTVIKSKLDTFSCNESMRSTKDIETDFWMKNSNNNDISDSFLLGLRDTIICQTILLMIYSLKRLFFVSLDLKLSCEFETCVGWEKFLRSLNTYLSYLFTWDIVFPASIALNKYFTKSESKKLFLYTFFCMIIGNCVNWFIVFLNDYPKAVAFSEAFEAFPGYLALLFSIGINKKLKCVVVLLSCNLTYIVCFYLIFQAFKNINSGTLFQFFIFMIESLYSSLGRLPLTQLGWHPESFVLLLRVYTAWFVGLKLSGLFIFSRDIYDVFKYLATNSALTILTHTNLKGVFEAFFINKIARKFKWRYRFNGRSLGEKLYYGTFFETDFFYVSVLLYFVMNHGGILSVPGIDTDKFADVDDSIFVMKWEIFLLVILMTIINEVGKAVVTSLVFKRNQQIVYYRLTNLKLRLTCDFISFACAYYGLLCGYSIRIHQTNIFN